jgi:hypothetical protein
MLDHTPSPTTYYLLPTTYYLLPTTYYRSAERSRRSLLPTTHYPLPTTHSGGMVLWSEQRPIGYDGRCCQLKLGLRSSSRFVRYIPKPRLWREWLLSLEVSPDCTLRRKLLIDHERFSTLKTPPGNTRTS